MSPPGNSPREPRPADDFLLEEEAVRLHELLRELASRLRPFPAFLNMVSVQAVELEPPPLPEADRGCVVVLPDGEICELALKVVPGIEGIAEMDQIEEFRELDLAVDEYILYAAAAIRMLYQELRRRAQ